MELPRTRPAANGDPLSGHHHPSAPNCEAQGLLCALSSRSCSPAFPPVSARCTELLPGRVITSCRDPVPPFASQLRTCLPVVGVASSAGVLITSLSSGPSRRTRTVPVPASCPDVDPCLLPSPVLRGRGACHLLPSGPPRLDPGVRSRRAIPASLSLGSRSCCRYCCEVLIVLATTRPEGVDGDRERCRRSVKWRLPIGLPSPPAGDCQPTVGRHAAPP